MARMPKVPTGEFLVPADPLTVFQSLKIHQSYCVLGSLGAYVVMQCEGIHDALKEAYIRALYAIEATTNKRLVH